MPSKNSKKVNFPLKTVCHSRLVKDSFSIALVKSQGKLIEIIKSKGSNNFFTKSFNTVKGRSLFFINLALILSFHSLKLISSSGSMNWIRIFLNLFLIRSFLKSPNKYTARHRRIKTRLKINPSLLISASRRKTVHLLTSGNTSGNGQCLIILSGQGKCRHLKTRLKHFYCLN